jgi:hypothetical protein
MTNGSQRLISSRVEPDTALTGPNRVPLLARLNIHPFLSGTVVVGAVVPLYGRSFLALQTWIDCVGEGSWSRKSEDNLFALPLIRHVSYYLRLFMAVLLRAGSTLHLPEHENLSSGIKGIARRTITRYHQLRLVISSTPLST